MLRMTVVIAGAGYGGLAAARALSRHGRSLRVILIDQHDYHLLQFQLHEAAVNKIDPETLALPMRDLVPHGIEFLQARITGFDFSAHVVHTDRGDVCYDRLVIALGGQPATYNIKGLNEHALMLKSLGDARRIRGHLLMTLSDWKANNAGRPYPIVVGGAGITGVELAAELSEGLRDLTHECGLNRDDVQLRPPRQLLGESARTESWNERVAFCRSGGLEDRRSFTCPPVGGRLRRSRLGEEWGRYARRALGEAVEAPLLRHHEQAAVGRDHAPGLVLDPRLPRESGLSARLRKVDCRDQPVLAARVQP